MSYNQKNIFVREGGHLTHGSLFSGIGGAELAARWMGWQNLFHCEISPFCRKVLNFHFPQSESYEDITKTDFTPWRGRIDVLTAGFPCQPFSVAGQRKGADDDRYLWPQVVRAIYETRPAWVVGENVAGILTMVQPGEEVEVGSGSTLFGESYRKRVLLRQEYVIETVCRDLEREGYEVQPFVIPACAVGAPHRRDRVWIVAHRDSDRQRERAHQQVPVTERQRTSDYCACSQDGTASHARSHQRETRHASTISEGTPRAGRRINEEFTAARWAGFPTTQPVICRGDDGLPGRLAGITFPRWRAESVKALGNAWVPQVACEIFRAIQQAEDEGNRPYDR